MNRKVDERLLLIDLGVDADIRGKRSAEVGERRGHVVREPPRVGPRLLRDDEDHGRLAVDRGVTPLHLRRLGHPCDLGEDDRPLAGRLHHDRLEVVDRLDSAQ